LRIPACTGRNGERVLGPVGPDAGDDLGGLWGFDADSLIAVASADGPPEGGLAAAADPDGYGTRRFGQQPDVVEGGEFAVKGRRVVAPDGPEEVQRLV